VATLLIGVPSDTRILHEEQFGPVAVVTSFEEWRDVRATIEDDDLALDRCVFTSDYDRALLVADEIDAGAVRINGTPSHDLGDILFGGNGDSGIGREGLDEIIYAMVRKKPIVL
jgi:glyceraldehyde-3-phosphate dehydrogenase [NAD(P)+]